MAKEIENIEALETWAYFITNQLHEEGVLNEEDHDLLLGLVDDSFSG